MFADLVNSTAELSRRSAEDGADFIVGAADTMREVIRRFGGAVLREAGDGVLAIFGHPQPREDHALQACSAALAIRSEFQLENGGHTATRLRIGVDSGLVNLQAVVADHHRELSPQGLITHLAAKVQQAMAPGKIGITGNVLANLRGMVQVGSTSPLVLADVNEPIMVHELLALAPRASRFEASVGHGLTHFVGRSDEMTLLVHAARRALEGRGHCIGVIGDAGLGKSRLLWELRGRLQGLKVLAGQGSHFGVRSPYFAICSVLRQALDLQPDDAPVDLAARIERFTGEPPTDLLPLLRLLGNAAEHLPDDAGAAWQLRERTRRAIVELLVRCARRQALAIFIEDLHTADDETVDLVGQIVARLADAPLLLLLAYRPMAKLAFEGQSCFTPVQLQPLGEAELEAICEDRLGADASLARLRRDVVHRVGGNPFFVEEHLRMMIERGHVVGEKGRFRLSDVAPVAEIPASIADVLEARIAHLSGESRRVLQVAAVIGRESDPRMLADLVGMSAPAFQDALDEALEAELLQQRAGSAYEGLIFRHALMQEVAYAGLRQRERRRLHQAAVVWLETHRDDIVAERVERLAHHALRAEDWHRAVVYLQLSARRSVDRAALRLALVQLDEALQVADKAPADTLPQYCAIDLRLALRVPLVALGQMARVGVELERAAVAAEASDDDVRKGHVLVFLTCHRWLRGSHAEAVEVGQRALRIAEQHGDAALLIPAHEYLGGALHALGRFAEAHALLSANVEALPETAPGGRFGMAGLPAVLSRATRCWIHEYQGRFDAARSDAAAAMRIARASADTFSIQAASFAIGNLHLALADWDAARQALEEGLQLAQRERGLWLVVLGPLLALALARAGQRDAARALVDRTAPRPDLPLLNTTTRLDIVQVYFRIGRIELATVHAEATLRQARLRKERATEALTLLLLGELLEAQDQPDLPLAELRYGEAMSAAQALHMAPLAAQCRLGLARTRLALGRRQEALTDLNAACAQFDALGMPRWLDQAAPLARRVREALLGPASADEVRARQ